MSKSKIEKARVLRRAIFAILNYIQKDFVVQQVFEACLAFFRFENCVVSLVTLQNVTCEQLVTKTKDF